MNIKAMPAKEILEKWDELKSKSNDERVVVILDKVEDCIYHLPALVQAVINEKYFNGPAIKVGNKNTINRALKLAYSYIDDALEEERGRAEFL